MKTVKQVSDLTGVSVRTLHYYDEIGLLKPTEITYAGYRLYDERTLHVLKQILFFRELDIPLKDIKEIMDGGCIDKKLILENQKKLLLLKRNRLDRIIQSIEKTLQGDNDMSFEEFDMSEYYEALEEFKVLHRDMIIKAYGSIEKYDEFIGKCRNKEEDIARIAIKKYGSIKKYVEAMKHNYSSNVMDVSEKMDEFRKDILEGRNEKLGTLLKKLTADLSQDPCSEEIAEIAKLIAETAQSDYEVFREDKGMGLWYYFTRSFIVPPVIEMFDKKYGEGAAKFIGDALKSSGEAGKPKIEILYKRLTVDISKDTRSKEIQDIIHDIVLETERQHKELGIDEGENHWKYTAEQYLSESIMKKAIEKNYGEGSAKFIGEAIMYYCEKIK